MKSVSSDTGFAAGTDFSMSENKCYSNEAGKACNKKVPFIFFVVVLAFFIALLLSIVIVCLVFAMKISFLESETASLRMASTLQQQQATPPLIVGDHQDHLGQLDQQDKMGLSDNVGLLV